VVCLRKKNLATSGGKISKGQRGATIIEKNCEESYSIGEWEKKGGKTRQGTEIGPTRNKNGLDTVCVAVPGVSKKNTYQVVIGKT